MKYKDFAILFLITKIFCNSKHPTLERSISNPNKLVKQRDEVEEKVKVTPNKSDLA